jgi:hypothetical protein
MFEVEMRCENCKWWDNSVQLEKAQADTTGLCRQLPPRRDKRTGRAVWPFTEDTDWCAAFTADPLVGSNN